MFDHRTSRKQAVRRKELSRGWRRASLAAAVVLTTITTSSASPPGSETRAETPPSRPEVQLELMPPLPLQIGRLAPVSSTSSGPRVNPHLFERPAPAIRSHDVAATPAAEAARHREPAEKSAPRETAVAAESVEAPPVLLRPAATVLTLRPISSPETRPALQDVPTVRERQSTDSEATEVTFVTPAVPPSIAGEGGASVVHAAPPAAKIRFSISDDGVSAKATLESDADSPVAEARGGVARLAPSAGAPRPSIVAAPADPIALEPAPVAEAPTLKPMKSRSKTATAAVPRPSRASEAPRVAPQRIDTDRLETPAPEASPATIVRNSSSVVIPVPRAAETPRVATPSRQPATRPSTVSHSKPAPSAASDRQPVVIAATSPLSSSQTAQPAVVQPAKVQPVVVHPAETQPAETQPAKVQPVPRLVATGRAIVIAVPADVQTPAPAPAASTTPGSSPRVAMPSGPKAPAARSAAANSVAARSAAAAPRESKAVQPQRAARREEPAGSSRFALPAMALVDVPSAEGTTAIDPTTSESSEKYSRERNASPDRSLAPRNLSGRPSRPAPAVRMDAAYDSVARSRVGTTAPHPSPTPQPSSAAQQSPAAQPSSAVPWDFSATPAAAAEVVLIRTAETQAITPRSPIRRAELENREICEAVLVGPHKLLLIGRQDGSTRLAVWTGDDAKPALYEVKVGSAQPTATGAPLSVIAQRLTETISAAYPQCHVRVVTEGDGLTVHGHVVSQETARAIMRLVRRACLTSVDDNLEIR